MIKSYLNEKWETVLEESLSQNGYTTFRLNISQNKKVKKCTGSILLVTVEGRHHREFKIEFLTMKTIGDSKEKIKTLGIDRMFRTEAFVYNKILPMYEKLQEDLPNSVMMKFPFCYDATEEYVVMEDLTMRNFAVEEQDLEFSKASFAIMELARFHALSFALKYRNEEKFEELVANLDKGFYSYVDIEKAIKMASEQLESAELRDKLTNMVTGVVEKVKLVCQKNGMSEKYHVICHGEYSSENLLFTGDENDEPIDMMMVDFQLSSVTSPMTDLLYLLLTSCCQNVLNKYENMLDIYHDSMRIFLKKFQLRIDDVYSKEVLREDIKEYFPFVLTRFLYTAPSLYNNDKIKINEKITHLSEIKLI